MNLLGRLFNETIEALSSNSAIALLVLAAAVFFLFFVVIYLLARIRSISRRRSAELSADSAAELARRLNSSAADIKILQDSLTAVSSKAEQLGKQQILCVQKVGFIRFDAFEDVGGEQSFALALLDANDTGVVLSSIYSRRESRIYAKQVSSGNTSHTLSREEEEAMRRAMKL
jgi:hypothetical protein